MGIALRSFEIPKRLECDEESLNETYGRFIAEPFERGYGVTIGNSLRRVLLSSLEGTAVTSIKINGVSHEFSAIPGVQEDITEIVLNVKKLVLRSHSRAPKTLRIEADGHVPAETLTLFDATILDTAAQLTALGNMKAFAEKPMAAGSGLDPGISVLPD